MLHAVLGWRPHKLRDKVRSDLADTATALVKSRALLLSGRAVRFRWGQMVAWGVIIGLICAQFVFGLYDGVLQVHWYVHFGSFYWRGFYLKPAWDANGFGLVHSGNWPRYRHLAFRDIAGPAIATMGVMTVMAKPKWWTAKPVHTVRLVTAPLVIIALTFALGVLGVYLAFFGLPDLWHHAFGAYVVPGTKWLGYLSPDQLLIGFLIGRVLHRYWAPVGATLQGGIMDRSVDRWQAKIASAEMSFTSAIKYSNAGLHILPAWQRRPLVPPVLRERWAKQWRENVRIDAHKARNGVILVVLAVFVLFFLLGAVGHYWAGAGHSVPYLFPGAQ
jgi:hypothetical protein